MTRPNFFIVGAPKSGTTAMAQYLNEHPSVFVCEPKEPHFFADDMPGIQFVERLKDYLELYRNASSKEIVCDASVWYLYSDCALQNIREFEPGARILLMLRRPDEMVPAMYLQNWYSRDEDAANFQAAWDLESPRRAGQNVPATCRSVKNLFYRSIAKYASQLERVNSNFPSSQVKIVFFEDFVCDPRKSYLSVLEFLHIDDDGREEFPIVNARKTFKSRFIADFLQRPPSWLLAVSNRMKKTFGLQQTYIKNMIANLNVRGAEMTVSDKILAEIQGVYEDEVVRLAKMTGRNLAHWLDRIPGEKSCAE